MNVGKKALSLTLAFSMVASTFLSAGGFAAKSPRTTDDFTDSTDVTASIKDNAGESFTNNKIVIKDSTPIIVKGVLNGDTAAKDSDSFVWTLEGTNASSFTVTEGANTDEDFNTATVTVNSDAAADASATLKLVVSRSWPSDEEPDKDSGWDLQPVTIDVVYTPDVVTPDEEYTVTFNVNAEGVSNQPGELKVSKNGLVTKPADPSKTGYTFGGWYKETECTSAWDFSADKVTADTTLYAKWTEDAPTTVPVTGVTLDKTTETLTVNGTVKLTATVTPEGATNTKVTWVSDATAVATVADGVVTAVAAGTANITVTTEDGSFTATCVVTVTAEPEPPVEDKVTTVTIDPATQTVEWAMTQQFKATVKDADGKDVPNAAVTWSVTGGASTINTDGLFSASNKDADGTSLTVTAKFAATTGYKASEATATVTIKKTDATIYTVSFMDGDKELSTMSVIKGETLKAFPDAPVKEGYTFKGWYTSETGTTKFTLDTKINKNMKLYAQYTENATVTFMVDGKVYDTVSVEAGKKVTQPADPIAPEGKQFKGWYVNVTDAEPFDFTTALTASQKLTLTAVFADVFKVTFNGSDGKVIKVVDVTDGEVVTPPVVSLNLDGATFIGWYDEAGVQFKGGKVTGNLTLTAKYAAPKNEIVADAKNDITTIKNVTPEQIKSDPAVKAAVIEAVTQMDDAQKSKLASDAKALAAVEDNYIAAAGIAVEAPKVTAEVKKEVASAAISGAALSAKPGETVNLAVVSAEAAPALSDDNALAELAGKTGSQQVSKIVKLDFAVQINGTEQEIGAPVKISITLEQSFNSSLSKLIHARADGVTEVVKNVSINGKSLTFTVSSLSPFAIIELTKKSSSGGGSSSSDDDSSSSSKTPSTPTTPLTPVVPAPQTLASVSASIGVYSDTNVPVITRRGSVYTFLFKSTSGAVPTFTVGNGSVLQTYTVYKNGGYYFQVKAIGQPGQSTGVYCNIPGRTPLLVTTVTIN